MEKIHVSGLKRNPSVIKSYFKKVKNTVLVTEDVKVIFPERYINRDLAQIGSTVDVMSIYAILDGKKNYAIVNKLIMQNLSPYNITEITIDNVIYKELHFRKGDVFITNTNLVKTNTLIYNVFDEFFTKGNIPWFLSYNDLSDILIASKEYTGSDIGKNPIAVEILASLIARNADDKTKFYRTVKEKKKVKPSYIGLNNIFYSFDNTGAKLVGGYFGQGVPNAMVVPETKSSEVTKILRA